MARTKKRDRRRKNRNKSEDISKNEPNIKVNISEKTEIRTSQVTNEDHQPRRGLNPDEYKKYKMVWQMPFSDREGKWKWHEARDWNDKENQEIISFLNEYKNKTWNEIEREICNSKHQQKHKEQPTSTLCQDARKRWKKLDTISIFDTSFRFRLTGKKRIWGIRIEHEFFIVWYERHHKICPIKS
jgi:hypothetical protein